MEWYVATNGLPTNDGSKTKPWDIGTAFTSPLLKPSDIIYLFGGRYYWDEKSRFELQFSGLTGFPIIIRSFPGELAILDTQLKPPSPDVGWFRVFGSNITLINLRFTCSSPRPRISKIAGSNPMDVFRGSVRAAGSNILFINCIFDNMMEGLAHQQVLGGGCYGCIFFNNGWSGPDRPHGHGIYLQNKDQNRKVLEDNISFLEYSHGIHCYGEAAAINYITAEGNICFDNGERDILIGSYYVPCTGIVVNKNYTKKGGKVDIGYPNTLKNNDAIVTNNTFPENTVNLNNWTSLQQSNNLTGILPQTTVVVRPNKYEAGRGHVIVYTVNNETSVTVDLSTVLSLNTKYEIYRVWQLDTPILTGTYTGPVSLPIIDSLAPAPISSNLPQRNMSGNFSVFIVKSPDVVVVPPPPPPPPTNPVVIIEPVANRILLPGESIVFKGSGDNLVWKFDVVGASNPSPMIGSSVLYKIPTDATKVTIILTGSGGTVSQTHNVGTQPPPPPPPTGPTIVSPIDGTEFKVGDVITATATGTNLSWMVDIQGAANPAPQTGSQITFTVPSGATKIIITLKGDGGIDTSTHNITTTPVPVPVDKVVISPVSVNLAIGDVTQFTVDALDASGNVLQNRVVTLNSSNPLVVTINNNGLAIALAIGSSVITASCEGKTNTAQITVSPAVINLPVYWDKVKKIFYVLDEGRKDIEIKPS